MSLISTMMESSAVLKRPTIGRDSAQGTTLEPFATVWSGRPCSCQQVGASVQLIYQQRNTVVTTTLYFPQDPEAEPNDILVVTDRVSTRTYLVEDSYQSDHGRGRLWQVHCRLIRAPE